MIDSNMMRSPILRDYLEGSEFNLAVIPDVMWIEAYKSRTVESIASTLSVVGAHSDQVVILKTSGEIALLDPGLGMTEATMRDRQGHDLKEMMEALELARAGDRGILEQLEMQWSQATSLMGGMLEGTVDILQSLPEMAEVYTADEIRRFRTSNKFTQSMLEKIFGSAEQICETLFASYGRVPPSDPRLRLDTYLYRFSLAIMMYMIWWLRKGSQIPKRHDRAHNDFIDLSFAVHATYFDGFMTEDEKANWMYTQLSGALHAVRAAA
ncbi:hypothetical protein EOA23_15070 [Mesorhizobium sp. M2A.F.Ca.ET.042.01.1.1]|uniref:hypothetical protein n=1 Tax=Mesorhizobium sp. M2A.F.Ca.ET.042.01.1.1 TaxID=2496745 RepID=UPI000FCC9F47|nr:hypothetical protein [Mesorhizobium sp. M2A.F.Ca.ET.042.01.1.1]RUX28577.1 hypothetical protein EOA23_15070 [Mesorhizobium sp. M2A.F.Ca.ET.042.01.1.1]